VFPQAYAGNRAPVPIYIHLPWMNQAKHQEYVAKFMDYALAQPNTWVSGKDGDEGMLFVCWRVYRVVRSAGSSCERASRACCTAELC
jgi:hypothetical protein